MHLSRGQSSRSTPKAMKLFLKCAISFTFFKLRLDYAAGVTLSQYSNRALRHSKWEKNRMS